MKTKTATSARSALFSIIRDSVRTHQPYRITSRAGDAVLLGSEDYENLIETLELLGTPGMLKGVRAARRDIKAGRTKPLSEIL